MSTETGFAPVQHDHSACSSEALQRATRLCASRNVRLTDIRRRVLADLWRDHRPASAYDILARLNAEGATHGHKPFAPPAVYRALEFLMAQGLVHRLATLNAFVGCSAPEQPHDAQFLICRACQAVAEVGDVQTSRQIRRVADSAGFALGNQMIEVEGLCPQCLESSRHIGV